MHSSKMRDRSKHQPNTRSKPLQGSAAGRYRVDPPDWQGSFPNLGQSNPSELSLPPSSLRNNISKKKPTKVQSRSRRQPLHPSKPVQGAAAGRYRTDPTDWQGSFPNINVIKRKDIFPFLELPSELRAEIYSILLGSRAIHIDYPGCKDAKRFIDGRPFLCSATISDKEAFAQHGWHPKTPPSRLYFAIRHSKCTGSVAEALPLWVLGLCRQVYSEASLVPFQENCFSFSAPQSIDALLGRLTPLQQKALTHVAVLQTSAATMWAAQSLSEPLKLPAYLNIKRLTIFIELCPANLNNKDERMVVTSVEVQDRLVSRMMVLWSTRLEKVEVMINNTGGMLIECPRELGVGEVEAWTGRIKKSLLPVVNVADEEGMDEESEVTEKIGKELNAAERDQMDAELDAICGSDSD